MPVFEQGYRRYDGRLSPRSPILAVAWQNVRPRLRWWLWVLLAGLLFVPYAVWGVMIFLTTVGSANFGGPPTPAGGASASWVAYSLTDGPNPALVLQSLSGDSLWMFWQILDWATLQNIAIPAIAAAGILAADRATGATQIYFARPVTRFEYLLSKSLAVAFFCLLTTLLPSLLIWIECIAFSPDPKFALRTWYAPFSIAGASAIYALWSCSIVLALSASIRRPILVAVGAICFYLVTTLLGNLIAEATSNQTWKILSPGYALPGATAPLFGGDLPDWLASPWLPAAVYVLPLVLLAYVWWRVRAVEVVT